MLNRPVPWLWVAILTCVWGAWHAWTQREQAHGPGVLAADDPEQFSLPREQAQPFDHAGFRITPLAGFALQARVLSREDYRLDALSALVPTDLALGWGRMSDSTVLKDITITQHGRFYFWQVKQFPIPEREIVRHSANMHLIPANPAVAETLADIRKGEVIRLRGRLVEVLRPRDGLSVRSSLTRDDSGAGACELIWVEDLQLQR